MIYANTDNTARAWDYSDMPLPDAVAAQSNPKPDHFMQGKKLTPDEIQALTPPSKAPKLAELAAACNAGACNFGALSRVFGTCIDELPHGQASRHPAIKIILGQLTYLADESTGPSFEALDDYNAWAAQP